MKLGVLAFVWLAACAGSSSQPMPSPSPSPGGSSPTGSICPSMPQLCGGTCCGTACVQIDSDTANCGGCGNRCSAAQVCKQGSCGCASGTNNVLTDPMNCGSCGHQCGMGETCDDGTCVGPPDMAGALAPCDCTGLILISGNQCPLSSMCVANNCCFENTQGIPGLMSCSATPTLCTASSTPQ